MTVFGRFPAAAERDHAARAISTRASQVLRYPFSAVGRGIDAAESTRICVAGFGCANSGVRSVRVGSGDRVVFHHRDLDGVAAELGCPQEPAA